MPLARLVACLVLLLAAAPALADGGYIPRTAYPAPPAIPAQQAIIVHRNNTETLIVESAFATDSPDVAWILPLPAPPTSLSLGEPGMVSSATTALRPAITHDLAGIYGLPLFLLVLIVPVCAVIITTPDSRTRQHRLVLALVGITFSSLVSAILLPSLGSAGGRIVTTPSAEILSVHRLGNFDFTVLTADRPAALHAFLAEHDFHPLSPAADAIIGDYIARKWCFVVGRIHVGAAQTTAVPPPLVATFPAAQAVFPMKFTAIANSTTHVNLVVIADQQASAAGFHCVAADTFAATAMQGHYSYREPAPPPYTGFVSERRLCLGSPDVAALMWNNCVVTRLTADLPPARMTRDVALSFAPLAPHRDHFYTRKSQGQLALGGILAALLPITILATVFYRERRTPSRLQKRILAITSAALLVAAPMLVLMLPTIPVHEARGRNPWYHQYSFVGAAVAAIESGEVTADITPAQLATLPERLPNRPRRSDDPRLTENPYTGQPRRVERSSSSGRG